MFARIFAILGIFRLEKSCDYFRYFSLFYGNKKNHVPLHPRAHFFSNGYHNGPYEVEKKK